MELAPELEERKVTIALPSEVWDILDGTNKMALADGGQGMESWIAAMILASVSRCLTVALTLAGGVSNRGQEYNA